MRKNCKQGVFAAVMLLGISATAHALPFNDDMVDGQFRAGSLTRPLVDGAVPVGGAAHSIESREVAEALVNPVKDAPDSIAAGERLFAINCQPCHGKISEKPYAGPPFAAKGIAPADISTGDRYVNAPDGFYYGVIRFGSLSGLMPRIGYKFSDREYWDVINYVRSVQKSKR